MRCAREERVGRRQLFWILLGVCRIDGPQRGVTGPLMKKNEKQNQYPHVRFRDFVFLFVATGQVVELLKSQRYCHM